MTRRGISLPWDTVTKQLDTLRPGAVTFLLGDTGMGKTTLIEQVALHCSDNAIPFRGAMTEMQGHEVIMRMAARELRFDIADVLRRDWPVIDANRGGKSRERLGAVYKRIKKSLVGVSFFDSKQPAAREVVADMENWATGLEGKEALYVVDHLGQFHYEVSKNSERIREAIIQLQDSAERFNVHLLFSHQYNRQGRKAMRSLYFPELDWAEGSAGIEQMAHNVVMMTNPVREEFRKDIKGTAERVRSGQQRYEDVVELDKVNLLCAKSRDLGVRSDNRGRGSIRQLTFRDGWYHTQGYLECVDYFGTRPDINDSRPIPSAYLDEIRDYKDQQRELYEQNADKEAG